jgi:hypothetical protein
MLFNRLGDLFYLSGANGYESEKRVENDSTMILNSLLVHKSIWAPILQVVKPPESIVENKVTKTKERA